MESIERIDQDLTLALNSLHTPFSDSVWQVFSDRLVWSVLYLGVAMWLFYRLGWKKALVVVLGICLAIAFTDQFANFVKYSVMRLRPGWEPYMLDNGVRFLDGQGGWFGFFSAHAANASVFAVTSTAGLRLDRFRRYKGYAVLIGIWAFCVGVSRVFVGRHYIGDVLVGFAAGVLIGLLFAALIRFFANRIRSRAR